jgi:hypothetical protein
MSATDGNTYRQIFSTEKKMDAERMQIMDSLGRLMEQLAKIYGRDDIPGELLREIEIIGRTIDWMGRKAYLDEKNLSSNEL